MLWNGGVSERERVVTQLLPLLWGKVRRGEIGTLRLIELLSVKHDLTLIELLAASGAVKDG